MLTTRKEIVMPISSERRISHSNGVSLVAVVIVVVVVVAHNDGTAYTQSNNQRHFLLRPTKPLFVDASLFVD